MPASSPKVSAQNYLEGGGGGGGSIQPDVHFPCPEGGGGGLPSARLSVLVSSIAAKTSKPTSFDFTQPPLRNKIPEMI